jgi:hypothetical protein
MHAGQFGLLRLPVSWHLLKNSFAFRDSDETISVRGFFRGLNSQLADRRAARQVHLHFNKEIAMSVRSIATKFMKLCGQGKHFDFMRGYYSADMVSVEGDAKETAGKEAVIRKSETFQATVNFISQDLRGPFFNGDDKATAGQFVVYMAFEFELKADRSRFKREEVGVYTVKNDIVVREQFFYDSTVT